MKKGIHPKVNKVAVVSCACGNTFTTISVLDEIKVEICSACHPFYTGQQKFVDTEGRIDKFKKKQAISQTLQSKSLDSKKSKKAKKEAQIPSSAQPTLKDLLEQARNAA